MENLPDPQNYFKEIKSEKEKRKNWNDVFKESGNKLVSKNALNFLIGTLIFFLVFIILEHGVGLFLVYNGNLDGIIQSHFNATIENNIDNEYKFNPTTNNDFKNNFNNNITFNLDEEFINKICEVCNSS